MVVQQSFRGAKVHYISETPKEKGNKLYKNNKNGALRLRTPNFYTGFYIILLS